MFEVPNWLQRKFKDERFSCPSCGVIFNASGVISVGIRNVDHKKGGNRTMLWVEYLCKKCGQKVGYEICDMSLQKLSDCILSEDIASSIDAFDAIDESILEECDSKQQKFNKPKKSQKKKTIVKSRITQTEVKQMKKILNESETFDQFLDMIGEESTDLNGKFKIGPENVD